MAYDIFRKTQTSKSWALGASWTTSTDDVEDRLRSLTIDVNNLNTDITQFWFPKHKNEPAAQKFVSAWVQWRDGAYKLIKSWREGWALEVKLAWNYMDNANEKLTELAEWRRRWERLSGESATSPSTLPPPKKKEDSSSMWKWIAALAVGAAGATLVAKKLGA